MLREQLFWWKNRLENCHISGFQYLWSRRGATSTLFLCLQPYSDRAGTALHVSLCAADMSFRDTGALLKSWCHSKLCRQHCQRPRRANQRFRISPVCRSPLISPLSSHRSRCLVWVFLKMKAESEGRVYFLLVLTPLILCIIKRRIGPDKTVDRHQFTPFFNCSLNSIAWMCSRCKEKESKARELMANYSMSWCRNKGVKGLDPGKKWKHQNKPSSLFFGFFYQCFQYVSAQHLNLWVTLYSRL